MRYRYADRVRGELRRDLNVVPELSVGFDSDLLVVPTVRRSARPAARRHRHELRRSIGHGHIATAPACRLDIVSGISSLLGDVSGGFGNGDVRRDATGAHEQLVSSSFRPRPRLASRVFSSSVETVAYPHIQNHRLYSPAAARVEVIDLAVAPVRVGYIMGSGDEVPDALRRMGVDVTMIDREMLTTGDLSRFDTIVVGVRASEARPDFVANQARLRAYMERGGTLIVQYQQTDYVDRNLPPFPVKSPGNSRVTDETRRGPHPRADAPGLHVPEPHHVC